jgi:HK97 gp10 family phage protein
MAQPVEFNFEVKGLKALRAKLDTSLFEAALVEVLNEAGEFARDKAREKAPEDTGALVEGISFEMEYPSVTVQSTAAHSAYVEYGTKGGAPTARRYPPVNALRGWARRHGVNPWYLMYKIGRDGTKPQPFMAPAERAVKRKLPSLVRTAAKQIAKKWSKKKAA